MTRRQLATGKWFTRRALLVGAVAVAGGVAFGVWRLTRPVPNPLSPAQGFALNPFVVIDQSGVTLVLGRAEMGQGVHTTLAALLAEELDLDWSEVRVVHGPASRAYANRTLAEAGLPWPDYAREGWRETLALGLGQASGLLGLQITGGSTSLRDAYEPLRRAGASAREALKAAAAERLGLTTGVLRTEKGAVVAPDGRRIPYTELAEAAARIAPPQVEPRPPSAWKLLGRALPKPHSWDIVTGRARYGSDIRLPGMKFASPRMNPRLGGPLVAFDPSPALAIPGVERVIDLGTGVAVVARNSWAAIKGAEAVQVAWGPAPYPASTEALFAEIEKAFEKRPNARLRDDGAIENALARAERVLEVEYRLPFLAHATMEPMNATALFSGDRLELWVGSQTPRLQAERAAKAVGLSPEKVRVYTPLLGGGFGRRLEADVSELAARVAKEMPGVPVQLVWSREEDMTHDFYRPGIVARLRGAVADGQALAFEAKIAGPSVTRQAGRRMLGLPLLGPDKGHLEGAFDQPYAIPNYRVEGYLADLAVPIGFWRSVGASHNGFIHESFIDELAHAAGRDPLLFRLALIKPVSDIAAQVLETAARMAGWDRPKPPGTGRGVAFTWSFGTPVAQVIEVKDEGGRIRLNRAWIACDVGRALDPGIVQQQMESGLIFGLSAAIFGRISFADGAVQERNFFDYDALRMAGCPRIEVAVLEGQRRLGGVGEPGTPPAAAALANALYDLTGKRVRSLPLIDYFDFFV